MKNTIKRSVLEEILEGANLFDDEVTIRDSYSGRYYAREGFGLDVAGESAVFQFLAEAGIYGALKDEDGPGEFTAEDARDLARAA
jgi:hypothetical protein